jgi:hypothetical protein
MIVSDRFEAGPVDVPRLSVYDPANVADTTPAMATDRAAATSVMDAPDSTANGEPDDANGAEIT